MHQILAKSILKVFFLKWNSILYYLHLQNWFLLTIIDSIIILCLSRLLCIILAIFLYYSSYHLYDEFPLLILSFLICLFALNIHQIYMYIILLILSIMKYSLIISCFHHIYRHLYRSLNLNNMSYHLTKNNLWKYESKFIFLRILSKERLKRKEKTI